MRVSNIDAILWRIFVYLFIILFAIVSHIFAYCYVLGSCDRASWAKCEEREREKTNKMQQLDVCY